MPYTGGYPRATQLQVIRGRYDFAVDGGAVGAHELTTESIPKGAYILGGFVEVDTVPQGVGASIQVKVESADDIVDGATINGAPWSTQGRKSVIPAFTGAATVKTTEPRKIVAVIEDVALTAGVFDVVLFYVELPD